MSNLHNRGAVLSPPSDSDSSAGAASADASFVGQALDWSVREGCLEVALKRPACNEIGTQTLAELEKLAAFVAAGAGEAGALVFYSTLPTGFCAGADLRELYTGLSERTARSVDRAASVTEVRDFVERIHGAFNTLDQAPLTTIAAVHGVCFGGGWELALTCDAIVADKSARFCFPELRLGLVPGFGGVPRLRRDVSNAVIRDLILTGRSLNAQRAHGLGLISQVVARGEALAVARLMARQAARFEPEVRRQAKAFVKPLPSHELEQEKQLFVELMSSDGVQDALARFVHSDDVHPYL